MPCGAALQDEPGLESGPDGEVELEPSPGFGGHLAEGAALLQRLKHRVGIALVERGGIELVAQ